MLAIEINIEMISKDPLRKSDIQTLNEDKSKLADKKKEAYYVKF